MSAKLRTSSTRRENGRTVKERKTLTATKVRAAKKEEAQRHADRRAAMTQAERLRLDQLRDVPDPFDDDDTHERDVLAGNTTADISHAGEALARDEENRADATLKITSMLTSSLNRTQQHVDAFEAQLERMADAYLSFSLAVDGGPLPSSLPTPEDAVLEETRDVLVVDMFAASHQDLKLVAGDVYVASSCVRQGWMPVAPYFPTVVITIRVLEVYRVARLRCPRLGIQAFVRALCDLHGVAPRLWLGTQFSIAFDVYLAILARVEKRVQAALGRDTPNWRLKNACPACMYKVEGEPALDIPFMCTFDGNNSLSRFAKRKREESLDGTTIPGASKERMDDRIAPGDYYLPREEVDRWAKEGMEDLLKSFPLGEEAEGGEGGEEEEEDGGCAERWQNMKEDVTSRAYGMYDETGFFPCLCRHGFVLVVVDMIKSGELAKYGLSITAHLLEVLGQIAAGYDIGCKFAKMVKAHPVLGKLAADKKFLALVGAFHGHGHARICALYNLMTYVKGVGLEALEGCESFFSKSNALASTTRYASRFHRQQSITTYLKHADAFDAYHGLSSLLCSKYRRALEIKATHNALLDAMRDLGVESREVFETWLEKEKAHLRTLSKEPVEETLEMEYYQKLVNMREAEDRVTAILRVQPQFVAARAETDPGYAEAAKATRRIETQRRHALELRVRALAAVHDLELRLGITVRWVAGDEQWAAAAAMVSKRRYQRALDNLQKLIICRMFELAKCNMSGTGYKLRKHIAKSLQARSKAVKAAITTYNEAALTMTPPKPTLDWEEVVEYAFLADFDLLREGRGDIRGEPWAQPAGRAAMDQHFKLLRADEEIQRLNVEIRRFVTYMQDEDAFLTREEQCLREEGNEEIAHQVGLVRMERARFTDIHMSRLVKLSKEPGFTGDIVPATSVSRERHTPVTRDRDVQMRPPSPSRPEDAAFPPPPDDDDDDLSDDDEDGRLAEAFLNIVRISVDDGADAEGL
ncbi:hypothetical protein B0H13DRAFT_2351364 [Mycena leptocephala]|nr:hypothetical protein B0H13DRAFT_2351364 [Mycena leptocephala]